MKFSQLTLSLITLFYSTGNTIFQCLGYTKKGKRCKRLTPYGSCKDHKLKIKELVWQVLRNVYKNLKKKTQTHPNTNETNFDYQSLNELQNYEQDVKMLERVKKLMKHAKVTVIAEFIHYHLKESAYPFDCCICQNENTEGFYVRLSDSNHQHDFHPACVLNHLLCTPHKCVCNCTVNDTDCFL